MNKAGNFAEQHSSRNHLNYAIAGFSPADAPEGEDLRLCVACRASGRVKGAVGHTTHPEYRQLALCAACIAHYDNAAIE